MGMLKKAASGVLALLPCSRAECTLRASKELRPFLRVAQDRTGRTFLIIPFGCCYRLSLGHLGAIGNKYSTGPYGNQRSHKVWANVC